MMITTCLIGLFVMSAFGVDDAVVPGAEDGVALAIGLAPGFGDVPACGLALADAIAPGELEAEVPGARLAIGAGAEPTVAPPWQPASARAKNPMENATESVVDRDNMWR
jgi:hypothetical protein